MASGVDTSTTRELIILLRCGHRLVMTVKTPSSADSYECTECGVERRVWVRVGAWRWHCVSCRAASGSGLVRWKSANAAGNHTYETGHETLLYVEGSELDFERITRDKLEAQNNTEPPY